MTPVLSCQSALVSDVATMMTKLNDVPFWSDYEDFADGMD
jgi:hypothetical protein